MQHLKTKPKKQLKVLITNLINMQFWPSLAVIRLAKYNKCTIGFILADLMVNAILKKTTRYMSTPSKEETYNALFVSAAIYCVVLQIHKTL